VKKIPLPDVTIIVFDVEEMRPACPLLQATMGGIPSAAHHFDNSTWLLAPTKGMKRYKIGQRELELLRDKVEAHHRRKKRG
jgi:hypothetical protein